MSRRRRNPPRPRTSLRPPPPPPEPTDDELASVVDAATALLTSSEGVGNMFAGRCRDHIAALQRDLGWIRLAIEMWKPSTSAHGQQVAKTLRSLSREVTRHLNAIERLEMELDLQLVYTGTKERLEPREKYAAMVARAFDDGPETLITQEILS